ncbi:MAG TPA: hypothetical protein VF214_09175, partial [Edaphobacter sp.]
MTLNKNILPKKTHEDERHFRFTPKEYLPFLFTVGLTLASLKSDDPWVVIPTLSVAAVCGILTCYWHTGPIWGRSATAILIAGTLLIIGWRELRKAPSTTDEIFRVSISNIADLHLYPRADLESEPGKWPFWFAYRSSYGDTASPLPAAIYANITNLTDSLQTISSFYVSLKTARCGW